MRDHYAHTGTTSGTKGNDTMNRQTIRDILLCAIIGLALGIYFTLGATV